jgi:virulence-associated protein VapD
VVLELYAGYTSSFGAGLQDMYFVKLANDSIVQNYTLNNHFYTDSLLPQGIQEIFRSHNFDNQGLSVYPNPAHADVYFGIMNKKFDIRNFSISVSDIAGKEVFRKTELHSEFHVGASKTERISIPCKTKKGKGLKAN